MSTFGKSVQTKVTVESVLRCMTCGRTIEDRLTVNIAEGNAADMSERTAALIENVNAQAEKRGWTRDAVTVAVTCGKCRDK